MFSGGEREGSWTSTELMAEATRLETEVIKCDTCDARDAGMMVSINGKQFRCPCGCNVFHPKHDRQYGCLVVCNACQAEYTDQEESFR